MLKYSNTPENDVPKAAPQGLLHSQARLNVTELFLQTNSLDAIARLTGRLAPAQEADPELTGLLHEVQKHQEEFHKVAGDYTLISLLELTQKVAELNSRMANFVHRHLHELV